MNKVLDRAINKGKEEGKVEATNNIVANMILINATDEDIIKYTKISPDELRELKKQLCSA